MGLEDSVGDSMATQKNPFNLKLSHFIPIIGLVNYIRPSEKTIEKIINYEKLNGNQDLRMLANISALLVYNVSLIPAAVLGQYIIEKLFK